MLAFAACNKEQEKGYTLNDDGTVNITIGCTAPENNAKQTFNDELMLIFFTAGDQIMVNGDVANPYDVIPRPTTVAGTGDNMSNKASVMNVPVSDSYEFFYPARSYHKNTDGSLYVNMRSEVNFNSSGNSFNEDNQAWPMYAECGGLEGLSENGVMLLNAVGVISPTIIYGPEWCDAAFSTLAGVTSFLANDCPNLRVDHVVIRSNQRMTGQATLNNTDPTDPYIVMDGGEWMPTGELDQVVCHVTNPQNMIPTGEIIALVGASGEGKTTLVRLILALIYPGKGEALIRAGDGTEYPLNADTRTLFSYVPQGNTILSGTIAENLRMGKSDATEAEMIQALKLACAWEFVEKLPDGLYTRLGRRGKGLSEGQAQRLAIARAVLRDAPILLLDEASSALDVGTERRVLRNIMAAQPNRTCIVTTHRPTVLNLCKRVYQVMGQTVTELDEESSARMAMEF